MDINKEKPSMIFWRKVEAFNEIKSSLLEFLDPSKLPCPHLYFQSNP